MQVILKHVQEKFYFSPPLQLTQNRFALMQTKPDNHTSQPKSNRARWCLGFHVANQPFHHREEVYPNVPIEVFTSKMCKIQHTHTSYKFINTFLKKLYKFQNFMQLCQHIKNSLCELPFFSVPSKISFQISKVLKYFR